MQLPAVKDRLACYYVSSSGDMTSATPPSLLKKIATHVSNTAEYQVVCPATPSREELPHAVNIPARKMAQV